jgi:hypothetical protein
MDPSLPLSIVDIPALETAALILDDAVLEAKDISYDPDTQTFAVLLDREVPGRGRQYVRSKLVLRHVLQADIQVDDDIPLPLHGLRYRPDAHAIELAIGGPMRVVLQVEKLAGELVDTQDPVPSRRSVACCLTLALSAAAPCALMVWVARLLLGQAVPHGQ